MDFKRRINEYAKEQFQDVYGNPDTKLKKARQPASNPLLVMRELYAEKNRKAQKRALRDL